MGINEVKNDQSGLNPCGFTNKVAFLAIETPLSKSTNLTVPTTVPEFPYRLAEINNRSYNLNKQWYVEYYAWHIQKNELVRKRQSEPINRQKTVAERLAVANALRDLINKQLREGKCLGRHAETVLNDNLRLTLKKMNVVEALGVFIEQKKTDNLSASYVGRFRTSQKYLSEYFENMGTGPLMLKEVNEDFITTYFKWLQTEKKYANKSINNHRGDFGTFLIWCMKKSRGVLTHNPMDVLEKLETVTTKHATYSKQKLEAIKNECRAQGQGELLLFIQFEYYLLVRPNRELRQLKVHHIDLDENRIFIPGSISKTKFDEYLPLAPNLRKAIEGSGLLKRPGDSFIFGNEKPYHKEYFWDKFKPILIKLGFTDRNYTIYSFKHTGAKDLYLETKDIMLVMRMCRHTTLQETQTYLRDIGIDIDYKTVLNGYTGKL
jgi:integrase